MLQIIIIVLVVAADQLTKYLLAPMLLELPGHTMPIWQGVFHLTYVPNDGASFGMLQGAQVFFIIVTSLVLVVAAVFMIKTRKTQAKMLKISLSLVIGGAMGNFFDRIVFSFVRDLFDFTGIYFPWIFNVADAALVVGCDYAGRLYIVLL